MKKNLTILLLGILLIGINTGCNKKRGCTDVNSDNYDSEAKEDDDTCIPTVLKFVGDFDSHGTIEIGEDTLEAYDQVQINVTDSTAEPGTGLIITIKDFDRDTYPLRATVTATHDFNVEKQTLDPFTYSGNGSISGRVLSMDMTRIEKIEILPSQDPPIFDFDTLYLNLYGIKEID